MLSVGRRNATKRRRRMLRRTGTASAANVFCRNFTSERLCDANAATAKGGCDAIETMVQQKARTRERTIMEMLAKQAPTTSSEIVKLIRKLRWVGLEEKAQQLEKELEQHAVSDPVISIQSEAD